MKRTLALSTFMSKHIEGTIQELTQECLLAAADAHHIAGCLMVGKIDCGVIDQGIKQLKRTVRYLEKHAVGNERGMRNGERESEDLTADGRR